MDKVELRSVFKKRVQQMNLKDKKRQSHLICAKLEPFLQRQKGVWTLFSPLSDEPDLLSLIKTCSHIQWAFPRVESKTQMNFYQWNHLEQLALGSYGIGEPLGRKEDRIESQNISGCIIPGIVFDFFGSRLGRGGGYYDRFLLNFRGLKLGVTFDQALTNERLPSESHDQKVDIVVSPLEWIEVGQSEVSHGY